MPAMLERLIEALERLGRAIAPVPSPRALQILQLDEWRLMIQGSHSVLCFDRRRRAVTNAGRVVVAFGAINQVVVEHHRDSDDRPEHWSVDLHVKGWFSDVCVGWTFDDVDASIAAARISEFIDRPVKAW